MNKNSTKIISLLLCIALLCGLLSGCAKKGAEEKPAEEPFISEDEDTGPEVYVFPKRTPVPFSEMRDDLYDQAAADGALEVMNTLCTQPHALKQLKQAWDTLAEQLDALNTDYYLAKIQYYKDVSDEAAADRMTELEMEYRYLADESCTALAAVLDSPYREEMIKYIDCDRIIEDTDGYEPLSDEEFRLAEEKSGLEQEYYSLADDPDASAEDFCSLYLRLLDCYIAMAAFDYDGRSPAEIEYEDIYSRDYLPEASEAFCEWVKTCMIPLENEVVELFLDRHLYDGFDDYSQLAYSWEELYALLEPCISRGIPRAGELLHMMTGLGLIDSKTGESRADKGFTVKLYSYGVPFIFNTPYLNGRDAADIIHELGHSLAAYSDSKPAIYDYMSFDVAEIHSQGMELLMLPYFDEIYGETLGKTAALLNVYFMLDAVLDGCVFDEFQRRAFEYRADGRLATPQDVEDLYIEVERSFAGDSGNYGAGWYEVSHTFSQPFYYISYAASAIPALSLLAVSAGDREEALEAYYRLIDAGENISYSDALEVAGLPNPFTEEGQRELSELLTIDVLEEAILGQRDTGSAAGLAA